ncbi:Alpha/Beta hydrolase protein [Massariosphaeria phaeospora]|uniref:Alpha/Beta hydrolase protein n=1 Tax=Massariosphaeria phaeospora TaxID=100035 RepID=A0A7C8MAI7_9PLEO|nr:Alpha/Beta hydrolase protein [Massariosphaeria phaeospora]
MLGDIAWRSFGFAYGMLNLGLMVGVAAIRDGAFTKGTSKEEKEALQAAQAKYWDVSQEPLPGFSHKFFKLKNGKQLHYVVNPANSATRARNVAIFIHGFPDSYLVWRQLLQSPNLQSHVLIAVDLPGFGGSDGLKHYGPEEVLEALTAFILAMQEQYLRSEGKLVMVTHDWGGIVGARLASEAKQLAHHWILAGAVIPKQLEYTANTHAASAKQMLHTWTRTPLNTRLLKNALATLSAVRSQIGRSFYIFIFNLPWPLATFFATMGNFWLVRIMHSVAAGVLVKGKLTRPMTPAEAGEFMAQTGGPGTAQITASSAAYSDELLDRTRDYGMREKIHYYREGLLLSPWEKSLETVVALSEIPPNAHSSSASGLFDDGPPGALKVPATLIHGKDDSAFETKLAFEGLSDYLVKGSQVLVVGEGGHWLPLEKGGGRVMEETLVWALNEETKPLKRVFEGQADVKFVLEK